MICAALSLATAGAALAQDAAKGEKLFKRCAACHQVGADAGNRTGPVLTGVIGRKAGSFEGYRYGKSMKAAGEAGLVWEEETLLRYLANPTQYLRDVLDDPTARARMSFKLKTEQDRRDVIAFLAGFSPAADTAGERAMPGDIGTRPTPADALCVRNASAQAHLFAVDPPDQRRETGFLAPGETLCIDGIAAPATGAVSVYESADEMEGCTRLVPVGRTEDMLKYVDFDRCFWSSNT